MPHYTLTFKLHVQTGTTVLFLTQPLPGHYTEASGLDLDTTVSEFDFFLRVCPPLPLFLLDYFFDMFIQASVPQAQHNVRRWQPNSPTAMGISRIIVPRFLSHATPGGCCPQRGYRRGPHRRPGGHTQRFAVSLPFVVLCDSFGSVLDFFNAECVLTVVPVSFLAIASFSVPKLEKHVCCKGSCIRFFRFVPAFVVLF